VGARIAARGGLEARPVDVEPGLRECRLELRPRLVVGDRRPEALELVRLDPVVARPDVQPPRRELDVEPAGDAVGPLLVGPLVARETQVAMLPEDLDLAAELQEQILELPAHLALVEIARAREVLARIVALEPVEPPERLRTKAVEHAVELPT
jgi:hypothetical protein